MKNYFKPHELACHCGCGGGFEKMDSAFMLMLNEARDIAGFPWTLMSAYRCWAHNTAVGSTSNNHPNGRAVDVRCINSHTRYEIISAALSVGFTRIGVHKTFIHLDNNNTQAPEVIWLY